MKQVIIAICHFVSIFVIIHNVRGEQSFSVDYSHNQFLKDGKPFRYLSGSLHYFQVPSVLWRDRMLSYKAAGLNAIQTYIEWRFHEPEKGVYNFSGDHDLVAFLKLAQELDLVVVLRTGPYIDAERDMGGFPYWLLSVNPHMKLRTSDKTYLKEVDEWYDILLPMLVPLLYKNGGPIITVQVENEYGSYGCDHQYTNYLRDQLFKYLGQDVVLFTTDGPDDPKLQCGKVENTLLTCDFGWWMSVDGSFSALRRHQKSGPLVNSEFYVGWQDYWERRHTTGNTKLVCDHLDRMLSLNASVTFYMLHGGTNFGFDVGSNIQNGFQTVTTSYDFDGAISEAGDPTPKYFAIRNIIGKHLPLPQMPLPVVKPKMEVPSIQMTFVASIFDQVQSVKPTHSINSLTFEQLKQKDGFILYSTNITTQHTSPAQLKINGLADRALIFVDSEYRGTLSRGKNTFQIKLDIKLGSKLDILVENQGRVCFGGGIEELKGITSNVTLAGIVLQGWNHYRIFENWDQEVKTIEKKDHETNHKVYHQGIPSFFVGNFTLAKTVNHPLDTFLRLDGWKKGIAFLNGFNLGRYWMVGPQITLYSPAHLFKPYPQTNTLVVFETEDSPCHKASECVAKFVKTHVIDAPVHSE